MHDGFDLFVDGNSFAGNPGLLDTLGRVLARRLSSAFGLQVRLTDLASPGRTTEDILADLPAKVLGKLRPDRPAVLVVWEGVNSCALASRTPAQVAETFHKIWALADSRGLPVVQVTFSETKWDDGLSGPALQLWEATQKADLEGMLRGNDPPMWDALADLEYDDAEVEANLQANGCVDAHPENFSDGRGHVGERGLGYLADAVLPRVAEVLKLPGLNTFTGGFADKLAAWWWLDADESVRLGVKPPTHEDVWARDRHPLFPGDRAVQLADGVVTGPAIYQPGYLGTYEPYRPHKLHADVAAGWATSIRFTPYALAHDGTMRHVAGVWQHGGLKTVEDLLFIDTSVTPPRIKYQVSVDGTLTNVVAIASDVVPEVGKEFHAVCGYDSVLQRIFLSVNAEDVVYSSAAVPAVYSTGTADFMVGYGEATGFHGVVREACRLRATPSVADRYHLWNNGVRRDAILR